MDRPTMKGGENMDNKNVVDIHGKKYLTVAGRVEIAHKELSVKGALSIETEMIHSTDKGIMFKAVVRTPKGIFTGHSYASLTASGITGSSPIEVAETSAIGRALGFAGYGIVDGMATAEEVKKSEAGASKVESGLLRCADCDKAIPTTVHKYSTEVLGRALCYDCQNKVKNGEKTKEEETVKQAGLLEPDNDLPF